MDLVLIIAIIIFGLMILALVVFAILYATGSPWRLTVLGRNLMYQKLILALILLSSFGALLFHGLIAYRIFQLLLYIVVLYSFINDVVQLWKIQHNRSFEFGIQRKKKRTRQPSL